MPRAVAPTVVTSFDGRSCPVASSAAEFVPQTRSLPVLGEACNGCRGCGIYCNATQAVFGEGAKTSSLMFIGEQPGDQEDLAGKPFVGPSGKLLDELIGEAGLVRENAYVTNAVKHFKWEPRGKRRIHVKPTSREIAACRPWLEAEISVIKPSLIVCLGATAAQSLLGNAFRLTQHRGEVIEGTAWAAGLIATTHPSSVLRMPDPELRREARAAMLADLQIVAKTLKHAVG